MFYSGLHTHMHVHMHTCTHTTHKVHKHTPHANTTHHTNKHLANIPYGHVYTHHIYTTQTYIHAYTPCTHTHSMQKHTPHTHTPICTTYKYTHPTWGKGEHSKGVEYWEGTFSTGNESILEQYKQLAKSLFWGITFIFESNLSNSPRRIGIRAAFVRVGKVLS